MSSDFYTAIVDELNRRGSELQKWRVQSSHTDRKEFYLLQRSGDPILDQIRSVEDTSYSVKLAVKKKDGVIGSAETPILPTQNITEVLNQLVKKAELAEEKIWSFSDEVEDSKKTQIHYEPFFRDFELSSQVLVDKFRSAIGEEKRGVFNSSELFLSAITDRYTLSNGKSWQARRTKIYGEVCFSSDASIDAQEYLIYRMGAHPEQINFKDLITISVESSVALTKAQLPPAGKFQVMVDAEVIGQLFVDALNYLDSSQKYYGLPFLNKGEAFIADFQGAPFEVVSNPELDYLLGSRAYDSEGNPLKKLPLVSGNTVLNNLTSNKYAEYLKTSATSSLGNIEILVDGEAVNSWKDQATLEILQFSGLFSNPRDLSFSSEIRLGRLWMPGAAKPVYVKGGSLSGKFQENFRKVRFSQERTSVNLNEESLGCRVGYIGPAWALLNDVVISS